MNVWAELLNPLPTGTDANDAANGSPVNNAVLAKGSNPAVYQLVITSPNTGQSNASNLGGDPDGTDAAGNPPLAQQLYTGTGTGTGQYNSGVTAGQVLAVVKNWGTAKNVAPPSMRPATKRPGRPSPGDRQRSWLPGYWA